MILFSIVDKAVFDDIFRVTGRAGGKNARHGKTLDGHTLTIDLLRNRALEWLYYLKLR